MRVIHARTSTQSEFASILETLDHESDGDDGGLPHAGPGGHVRPDAAALGKDWLLQLIGSFSAAPAPLPTEARTEERAASYYAQDMADAEPPAARRPLPDDQASVAAELALRPDMGEEELRRIRRAFALANHPDRLLPEDRVAATRRMTIANMLIDQLLKRKTGAD